MKPLVIESAQNDSFKTFLSLTSSKGLKKEGMFLLSGEKLIREFLAKPNLKIIAELTKAKLEPLVSAPDVKQIEFTAALFDELDVLGTHFNILVVEQPKFADLTSGHKPRGIEVVMPVGDPGNLGALMRSCEAFGVSRVILTQEAAHPFLPKAVKASAGSVLRLPLMRGPSLAEFPDDCIALDLDGTDIGDFKWPRDGMLVVGEEGAGFSKKFRQRIRIPTQGVESLNVVVAASVALAHRAWKKA